MRSLLSVLTLCALASLAPASEPVTWAFASAAPAKFELFPALPAKSQTVAPKAEPQTAKLPALVPYDPPAAMPSRRHPLCLCGPGCVCPSCLGNCWLGTGPRPGSAAACCTGGTCAVPAAAAPVQASPVYQAPTIRYMNPAPVHAQPVFFGGFAGRCAGGG